MKCKHYLLPWKPGFNCACSLVHNIKSWPYSVFLFLTCLCLLFFLCSAGFTKGRVCQSPCAPPQQGLKIHSLHLPCFTPPTHMSFSMSAETHTHFLSQAHCTDDTSSPHDTSSSRRKTSKSAFSCQWHPEFRKIKFLQIFMLLLSNFYTSQSEWINTLYYYNRNILLNSWSFLSHTAFYICAQCVNNTTTIWEQKDGCISFLF